MGEDVSERLDVVPAQFSVIATRRQKYACRSCEDVVVQAPALPRLVEGGIPTEATVAHVLVSKYADHLPLYRQAQIYAHQSVNLDRSTLADWVGKAAFLLRSVHERLFKRLKASDKLFADETTAPVLDPGRGRTKTGQLFAYARDDRPWDGAEPPGVAYLYAPDRKDENVVRHLQGFVGTLQVDGYVGYKALADRMPSASRSAGRMSGASSTSSREPVRRRSPPRPSRALRRFTKSRPRSAVLSPRNVTPPGRSEAAPLPPRWSRGSGRSSASSARRPSSLRPSAMPSRAKGLARFLDDGRIEIDNNVVERSIRPIALNRKNALFAGSDGGGEHWAVIASLVETCKLNGVDPQAYLADIIIRIVNGHPQSQIDELMPWAYAQPPLRAVA